MVFASRAKTSTRAPSAERRSSVAWSGRPQFLNFWTAADHGEPDRRQIDFADRDPIELDCLHGILAPGLLQAAASRAQDLGVSAERILFQWGAIGETAYLQRLAQHLDVPFIDPTAVDHEDCRLTPRQVAAAAESGVMPLAQADGLNWVVAPTVRFPARVLCELARRWPAIRPRLRLTSAAALQRHLMQEAGGSIGDVATHRLHRRWPSMSAGPSGARSPIWRERLLRCMMVLGVLVAAPLVWPAVVGTVLALWFIGFAALRLIASYWPRPLLRRRLRQFDDTLPIFTVIAALYREANSVTDLIDAINALDYPPEKLDVILVLEADDLATLVALDQLQSRPHLQVLIAPTIGPRTKPKALNCALAFARGDYLAVFDAEDRPDPGQLRAALDAFELHGPATACVQASLCIDNTTHSWLSHTFLAEYAGQFDLVLPGLSAMGMPLPLGGTSNHFRTSVLRAIGGWDPYNVTEDADLGFRLARLGYRSVTFASTTYEEAPVSFGNWLPQRSRWMKGFIQTWLVHMRHPLRLWREIGGRGLAALNLIVAGNVVTALAYPALLAISCVALVAQQVGELPWWLPQWLHPGQPTALHCTAFVAGYVSTIVVGLRGLAGRGELRRGPVLLLTPVYWLCLSIAAWRAVLQFVWSPYKWDKTTHGVAGRRPSQTATAEQRQPAAGRRAGSVVRDTASNPLRPFRGAVSG
jgi:hypothetical protein